MKLSVKRHFKGDCIKIAVRMGFIKAVNISSASK
jgi:hypothetical protein